MRAFAFAALLVACSWFSARALADDAAPASPVLVPPELERSEQAEIPTGSEGVTGVVVLVVSIDAAGHVTDAVVEGSLEPSLDEAARQAVLRFAFKPATRDGVPIASRIRYSYAFRAPDPPPVPPATGALLGEVLDATSGAAIVGADLVLSAADGTTSSAFTDASGRFAFRGLVAGHYELGLTAFDREPAHVEEDIAGGEELEIKVRLRAVSATAATTFGAVARTEAPPREIVRRGVAPEELVRMAGTRGDPLRTIELLPGVARPPAGAGMVLVRGSAPGDSEVFLDGAPVYGLYHFGGMTSVVNGFLLKGIDLYPGNFSVRYGRKTGGVIETNFRDPKTDALHGILDLNLIDSSLLVEAPITDELSFAVAARRSYLDAWFKAAAESSDLNVVAAPVYYDYQSILAWRPSSHDRVRLIGYGSYDELTLIVNKADEHDPAKRGRFGQTNSFHRGQLEWHRDFSERVDSDLSVGAGPVLTRGILGPELGYEIRGFDIITRGEVHTRLSSRLRLNAGFDTQILQTHLEYHGPKAQQDEGDPSNDAPLSGRDTTTVDMTRTYARPAGYVEVVAQATERLELTAGTRVDYFGEIEAVTVDPRLNGRLTLGSTTLRSGVGFFSQPPDITQTVAGYGNPKLDPFRALHIGAGVEQRLSALATASIDGFYKLLSDRVINGEEPGELKNGGKGRIYGLEVMGRLEPGGRFSGFLSYTLSRSERNDRDGNGYRLFDYDQTHILTASGNVKLGRGFLLGSTFRLASGNPHTPITGGLYNANLDVYEPLYGDTNSRRSSYFHRLDVRVEKKWTLNEQGAGITAYLDVQNAYNRLNAEGAQYNFDYSETKKIPGLPIIPSLGVRGEL